MAATTKRPQGSGWDWASPLLFTGGLDGCLFGLVLVLIGLVIAGLFRALLWLARASLAGLRSARAAYNAAPHASRRALLAATATTLAVLVCALHAAGLPALPLHVAGTALAVAALLFRRG
jgi:hypothetical protein